MKPLTVTAAHEAIAESAQSADHNTRHVESIAIGEFARQGDLYIQRIERADKTWRPTSGRQLAPGVSTGSRHVAVGDGVAIRVPPNANPVNRLRDGRTQLLGPQVSATERFVLEHPEHAHVSLPAGDYQVTYQLDFQRQQAVRD